MRIEKHLIGQTFIVRYMEDTDSDIIGLRFLITSSLMWISNRGHVFRDGGIILHPSGVLTNVLMQKNRRGIRKTSDLSKSDCSLHDINIMPTTVSLFTMKAIEKKLCRVVYGVRLHCLTRFETGTVRKLKLLPIVQSETSGHVVIIHCFLNNPRH